MQWLGADFIFNSYTFVLRCAHDSRNKLERLEHSEVFCDDNSSCTHIMNYTKRMLNVKVIEKVLVQICFQTAVSMTVESSTATDKKRQT